MDDTKAWYASSGVWGGIIAVVTAGLGFFHFTISAADQVNVVQGLATAGAAVGGLVAVIGRIAASKKIGSP